MAAVCTAVENWQSEFTRTCSQKSAHRCYSDPTFTIEGRGARGKCGGCRHAYYSSKEAQAQHWKFHKKVCSPPNVQAVGEMNAEACVRALKVQLMGAPTSDTAAIIHRLGFLLVQGEVEDAGEVGLQIHSLTRVFIPNPDALEAYYFQLWAVPGMVQVLLASPLQSKRTKHVLALEAEARSARAAGAVVDEAALEEARMARELSRDTGAYEYAFLLFGLLGRSSVRGRALAMSSNHDGAGVLREAGFARAAATRALQLWLDPNVRRDCGMIKQMSSRLLSPY